MHPSVTVYDDRLHQFINAEFEIGVLDSTCRFSEGPVWNKEGFYLFSDIPQNVIYKIEEGKGKQIYLEQSGCGPGNMRALSEQIGSNGLAYDSTGNLLICQHGNGAVALYNGTFSKPHIASYNGRPFNSPNDVVVQRSGAVFFSDPPYGLKDQRLDAAKYQAVAAVYKWQEGQVQIVTDRYQYPNGVCLSPDERSLYTCSNKPFEAFVLEWDAETLQAKRQVAAENGDGMKCDRFGNLYLCNKDGLLILDGNGKRLGLIALKTVPANCCWGGNEGRDLLVTARQHIFLIPGLQKA
jgi:gluconolactonase